MSRQEQQDKLIALLAQLMQCVAEGDEYHAEGVREDMLEASSLARLLHPSHQDP